MYRQNAWPRRRPSKYYRVPVQSENEARGEIAVFDDEGYVAPGAYSEKADSFRAEIHSHNDVCVIFSNSFRYAVHKNIYRFANF